MLETHSNYPSLSISVETDKPVAFDSPDHIQPWGTVRDNSIKERFNQKLFWWLPKEKVSVLDIGCSGGGFVKSMLDSGCLSVGLEGSDISKKTKRAEWATIPEFLFTADATAPYNITFAPNGQQRERCLFSVVTAWEFIEHIAEENLPGVMENIDRHLCQNGVVIMSISPNEEVIDGVVLHQCVHEKDWWINKFTEMGWKNHENALKYFEMDFVRGSEDDAPGSFHVVLTRIGEELPYPEKLSTVQFEYSLENDPLGFTNIFMSSNAFQAEPLRIVDVGAAAGFEAQWDVYQNQIELVGFEPDAAECARLQEASKSAKFGRREQFFPVAIGEKEEKRTLQCTINPQASSVLTPNVPFISRFPQGDIGHVTHTAEIHMKSLDAFCVENQVHHIDFLKLDVEGCELEALKGARRMIETSVLGLSIEIFFQPYRHGQPTYGEIESFLRPLGFNLFDISLERWQRKTAASHQRDSWYEKGQIMWGNALFLRDLLSTEASSTFQVSLVKLHKLASIAEVYGFNDYAVELMDLSAQI